MSYVPTGLDEDILQHIGEAASSVHLQDFNIHQGEFLRPVLTHGAALVLVKLPCWKLRSGKRANNKKHSGTSSLFSSLSGQYKVN